MKVQRGKGKITEWERGQLRGKGRSKWVCEGKEGGGGSR